jgi:2-keto-3-deoxy-L-rhamnonate aldolase RhmA
MRANKLRQALNADQPTMCARVNTVWPDVVELIGLTGVYDYVEFAAEYGPFTLHDLDNFCRAAELYDLSTMIKVDQAPRLYQAQRAIGAGFQSVLFVDCRTVEDVQECVRVVRPDTPDDDGIYGAAARRFAYDMKSRDEFSQALRDIVVAIMVEKKALVDNLDEVLALPGVDMVQWGPSDYSMSAGLDKGSDEVKAAERQVIEKSLAAGVPPRIELMGMENIDYYLDLGVRHFRMGTDMAILKQFWQTQGDALRARLAQI